MRKILSIDGGGIRGASTCCLLIELERQTGQPARETFDMIAGTSTGALLAAALAVGIPAKEILPIYTERAPREIFTGALSSVKMVASGYRYESRNIANVLRDVFGVNADWTLNSCPVRVLLTAMHVSGTPMYFVKDGPRNAKTTGRLSLIDCATASAAAPTYFNSWYVSPLPLGSVGPLGSELVGHCFDGGVGVTSNPVHQACVEAFKYDDFDPKDTRVISLGTGYYPAPPEVNPPSGLLGTISWVIDSLLATAHDEQTELVEMYYPGIMRRINWELPHAIDMADTSALPTLVEVGKAAARQTDWAEALR